jgi:hypothetical protein
MQRDLCSDRPPHMKRNAGAALAAASSSDAQLNRQFHDMEISAGGSDADDHAPSISQKRARRGSHHHHALPAYATAASAAPLADSRTEAVEPRTTSADPDPDPVMTPALSRQAATEIFIRRQLELRAIADARESSRCASAQWIPVLPRILLSNEFNFYYSA